MKRLFFIAALAVFAVGGAYATNANRVLVWGEDGIQYDCEDGPIACTDQLYFEDECMNVLVDTSDLSRFP